MADINTQDVIQAFGLTVAMIGALMEGANVLPSGEFGRQLALLATVTRETQPAQADVLDRWAAMTTEVDLPPKLAS